MLYQSEYFQQNTLDKLFGLLMHCDRSCSIMDFRGGGVKCMIMPVQLGDQFENGCERIPDGHGFPICMIM